LNCAYHLDRPVQAICSTCGRPICDLCAVDLSGQVYCKPCLEVKVRKPARDIHSGARFLLSLVPGVGHLYMGLVQRGMQFLLGWAAGWVLLTILFPPLLGVWIPLAIFYSVFDAREAHLRLAQGLEVEDKGFVDPKTLQLQWNHRYVAYVLVGIGALILFNTLTEDVLRVLMPYNYGTVARALRGTVMGGLAIWAGVYLLQRNANDSRQ
jgi:hypothetical protein